jgi:hypothetical protein
MQEQNFQEVPFPEKKQVLEHVCSPAKKASLTGKKLVFY